MRKELLFHMSARGRWYRQAALEGSGFGAAIGTAKQVRSDLVCLFRRQHPKYKRRQIIDWVCVHCRALSVHSWCQANSCLALSVQVLIGRMRRTRVIPTLMECYTVIANTGALAHGVA
jgi:hypothetical protein